MKEFEKIIDSIKRQLIPNDPTTHNQASFLLLKSICENNEEAFLTSLIDSGIISNIMRIINPINQGYVLNSIEIVSKSDVFYKNCLVDEAITNIIKGDYIHSQEEATVALIVLHRIVTKVFQFKESQGLCLMHQHAEGLLSFISQPTFDPSSLICATDLLNFIIKYSASDFKQTNFQSMEHMYRLAMEYLISVEICSDLDTIRTICCISTSIVKKVDLLISMIDQGILEKSEYLKIEIFLCYEIDVTSSDVLSANNLILFDFIKFLAVGKVIPHLQKLDIDIESAEYFVEFLEIVINLRGYKNQEICDLLLKNGYLKYLLHLSVLAPERLFFRMQACRVISKIIVGLKEYLELPIENWLGGSAAFQSFLSNGLRTLPIDFQQWEDLLKTENPESKSLLVLLYCHFIATNEKYIFTQKSLALNLKNVVNKTTEPIFLKAVFLLYSVSALSSEISNSPSNPCLYSKTIKKFATTVQKHGRIELFYTHHEDLLIYSIREIDIPEGLRIKVIRLWLDKSNTDKEFDALIKECLDQGYDELKIVKLLMGLLHQNCMENLNNVTETYTALLRYRNEIPEDVVEFILKTLAEDLASYTPSNLHILKIVLRFACTLPTSNSVSSWILRDCAKNIGKIVIREDTDLILKTLLITQAAFTIRHSLASNDSTVAAIFLKKNEFLNEVYETGIMSKGVKMKYSIRTLICLIFCQKKFNLQCKSVSQMTFKDFKNLLIKMLENNSTPTLGVELIKLLLMNRVNNPLIDLYKSKNPKYMRYIFDVYFLIHKIHYESIPGKEEQIYECLSTILDYSYLQKLNVNVLLTCAATPDLMQNATNRILKSNLLSLSFLDFATKWLTYRNAFRKQTRMKIKTLTEESVDILVEFRPFAEKMKDVNQDIVQDFLTAIEIYLANYQQ